jgi:fucose permease
VAELARARFGAPEVALILGAVVLIALAPLLALASEAAVVAGQAAAAGPVPWGTVLLLGLLLLVYSGTEIAVGGWATLYLEMSAGMAPAAVALALSGFWLALTAGRALGALLGLRIGTLALLGGSLTLILLAATLLLATVGQASASVLALALLGLGCGPVFPTTMALVTSISGGRSAAASLALAVGNLGAGSIPPLLGVVLNESGPRAGVLLLLAAALVMPLLLAAVALRAMRRPVPAQG